jgi:hypothetical protein
MSLSSSTLAAIQKAGAAVFVADEKLKQAAQNYAERVNAAIAGNPYHLGNDALIENWKTVARLSQTIAGIEAEIKKVFQVAAELTGEDQPSVVSTPVQVAPKRAAKQAVVVPAVKAPVASGKAKNASKSKPAARAASVAPTVPTLVDLAPTDVVIKPSKKAAKPKALVAVAPKSTKLKPKQKAAAPKIKTKLRVAVKAVTGELSGNAAKLLQQLELVLNANDFAEINQTVMAKESGIALGSMTAALKKLMALGRIAAGPAGRFKLTPLPVAVDTAEAVQS